MKSNAIVRICLYSLLILLLLGVLLVGMFGPWHRSAHTAESMAAVPVTAPTTAQDLEAVVTAETKVYNRPTEQSGSRYSLHPGDVVIVSDVMVVSGVEWGCIGDGYVPMEALDVGMIADIQLPSQDSFQTRVMEDVSTHKTPSQLGDEHYPLRKGMTVTVTRVESIMGEEWAFLEDLGWVQMRYLEAGAVWEPPSETPPSNTRGICYDDITETVTSIDIEWPYGEVRIQSGDGTGIQMSDEAPIGAKEAVFRVTENHCLKVEFGLDAKQEIPKTLYLTLPMDMDLKKLEVETKSAEVYISDLPMEIGKVEVETESGSLTASFLTAPGSLDLETVSGDLDITLPENCGFTAALETASGHLTTDYNARKVQNGLIYSSGACKIQAETQSGDLNIWKPVQ